MPATPVELENLLVRLTGDSSGYRGMLAGAVKETNDASVRIGSSSKIIEGFGLRIRAFAGSVGGFMQTVVPMLGVAGGIGGIFQSVQEAASAEAMETSFGFLIGSAEKAEKALNDLRRFADVTPFETPEVIAAAKQMLAFGATAEDIVPTMRVLGDVSSALEIPLGQLSYLFGTLKAQGRAFTVDINQFAMRGIPIWAQLEHQFGKTNTQIRKMVEGGKIGFADVEAAFKATSGPMSKFTGGMAKQAETLMGLYSTLKSEVGNALREIGSIIMKETALHQFVKDTGVVLKTLVQMFKELSPEVKRFAVALAGGAIALGLIVTGFLAFKALLIAVLAFVNPFTIGLALVVTLIASWIAKVGGLGKAWEIVKQKLEEVWNWLQPVGQALESLWNSLVEVALPTWTEFVDTVKILWDDLMHSLTFDWGEFQTALLRAIFSAEFAVRNWGRTWDIIFLEAGSSLLTLSLDFMDVFTNKIPRVIAWFVNTATTMVSEFGKNFRFVMISSLENAETLFRSLPDIIAGRTTMGEVMQKMMNNMPMLTVFEGELKKFPKMIDRQLTPMEQAMRKVLVQMWGNLDADRQKFIAQRMSELGLITPEALAEAEAQGSAVGKKAAEGVIKEMKRMDAVAFGSAEHLARLDEYREKLRMKDKGPQGFGERMFKGIQGQGGFAFGRKMHENIGGQLANQAKLAQEETNKILRDMLKEMRERDPLGDQPIVVLHDAGILGG